MRVVLGLLTVAISLLFVDATPAFACDCHEGGPVCEDFWKSPVVFTGRVLTVESIGRELVRTRFQVVEQFRGAPAREIEVVTSITNCDLYFSPGQQWLIYGFLRSDAVGISTSICSRSRRLEHASSDLAYVRSVYSARSDKGRIFGRLVYGRNDKIVPVRGVTVTVNGPNWTPLSSITDSEGRYEVLAPAGNYTINSALPRGMTVRYNPIVTLADSRGCVEAELWADYTGEISGRIIDRSGGAVPNLTLELIRLDGFDWAPSRLRTITDMAGRFELTGVSIGSYRLGIVVGSENNEPRFQHLGGAADASNVPRFFVEGGETVTLGSLTLPKTVRIAHISGVVVNRDDQPRVGIKVRIKVDSDGSHFPWTTVATDERGRFAFALATGIRYRIVAEPWDQLLALRNRTAITNVDPSAQRTLRLVLP